jgi:hypothetical protein
LFDDVPLDRDTGSVALLVAEESRIEGPQREVLHVLLESLIDTLRRAGHNQAVAEELAHRQISRAQARLAQAGYIIRDLDELEEE